jgi:hypothetical protein
LQVAARHQAEQPERAVAARQVQAEQQTQAAVVALVAVTVVRALLT